MNGVLALTTTKAVRGACAGWRQTGYLGGLGLGGAPDSGSPRMLPVGYGLLGKSRHHLMRLPAQVEHDAGAYEHGTGHGQ